MTPPLEEIAALVKRETGVVVKDSQHARLEAVIGRIAPGMPPSTFLEQLGKRLAGPPLLELLIDQVTVQETYFFREDRELHAVDWSLLQRAAEARGRDRARVWVPACASGDEAYTLAMLALEAKGRGEPGVSILATDVAAGAIAAAEAGSYSARAVRNVPQAMYERHFRSEGTQHLIREPVKSMVKFRRHNLVTELSPPGGEEGFDLICCRNLLIYFDGDTVQRVLALLESALQPKGELILGAADRLSGTTAKLADLPALGRPRSSLPVRELRRPLGLTGTDPVAETDADRAPATDAGPAPAAGRDGVRAALAAVDGGDFPAALRISGQILEVDSLNAEACFVSGLAELELGSAAAAVASLRRCLYLDPTFDLAAFELGRAHDATGDTAAAERAYQRALLTLDSPGDRDPAFAGRVDLGELAKACRLRLDPGREPAAK